MDDLPSLVNGEATDLIDVHDRGLLYGQSLFETVAVQAGKPLLINEHIKRLERGCSVLGIDYDRTALLTEIEHLSEALQDGVVRLALTMGSGGRGYRNPGVPDSRRILSAHEYPTFPDDNWSKGITLGLSEVRLGHQPLLAGIKHSNRLEQVLARSQWQTGWQEALLCDQDGSVIEATQSNVFIRHDDQLLTPKLDNAGVAGVMREFVLRNAEKLGCSVERVRLSLQNIKAADEVFLTNSIIGLWPVKRFAESYYTEHNYSHQLLDLMQKNGAVPTH